MQVGFRQCQKLPETHLVSDDPQNFASRTVTAKARCTIAPPTSKINLTHNTAAHKPGLSAATTSPTNSWPGCTGESVIALKEFQVSVADVGRTKVELPHSLQVFRGLAICRSSALRSRWTAIMRVAYHLFRLNKSGGEDSMKAIRVREFGPPAVMKLEDVPDPQPGARQLVVAVKAAGINPVDTYIRAGTYAKKPALPYTRDSTQRALLNPSDRRSAGFKLGDRVYINTTSVGRMRKRRCGEQESVFALS